MCIRDRDEMICAMREYMNVCKASKVTVRRGHTDNAKAHVGAKMKAFWRDEVKAVYTTIVPNEPRQNGCMERQWRNMANDSRTLCTHAKLPKNYVWYALRHAVEVANTLPHKDNASNCSDKLFTGHTPNVTQFRVWGCMMYAKIYNPVTKMADKAVRCLHLGRLPSQPGYLGLDPETGKLVAVSYTHLTLPTILRV